MRQEIELDFDSICSVDLSPNTVLPSIPQRPGIKKRSTRRSPKRKDLILNVKDNFTEIRFDRGCRSSRRNSPRPDGFEANGAPKRESVYQSSDEVGKIEVMGVRGGRKKIEVPHNDSSLSFCIVDSLCSSDEENSPKGSPASSLNTKLDLSPASEPCTGRRASDGFIEISLDSENNETVLKDSSNHLNNGKELLKRDKVHTLQKSFSAKVEMPQKQFSLESGLSYRSGFSPFRKMLDPFMKSKSVRSPFRSPFSYGVESRRDKAVGKIGLTRNKTYRKSLLQDFSNTTKSLDCDSHFVKNDHLHSAASSPVHLHGTLKLGKKHGMPFFEFSQSFPEDVYVAKTWKTGNGFKWVYTFHTLDGRKKSNAGALGLNDSCENGLMVGQMQVSCYLSSELRDGGFENSMVTEFVFYDIARAKRSTASKESFDSILDAVKSPKSYSSGLNDETPQEKSKLQPKNTPDNHGCDILDAYPWESADLHPDLESAAIVMQIPFSKRESLKYTRDEKTSSKMNPVSRNLSMIDRRKNVPPNHTSEEALKVVIPIGNHGLPVVESNGPSSLLDRWRSGGGCDCGGWDMGCPLLILSTNSIQCPENHCKEKQTFELFLQGVKDTTPALAMNIAKDGQYAVDFHAQLSTLQAFSICVAILHATEACTPAPVEETKQPPRCDSLKALLEEEVKFLVDAVTLEEKKKEAKVKKPQSFVLNPPFSPIARV